MNILNTQNEYLFLYNNLLLLRAILQLQVRQAKIKCNISGLRRSAIHNSNGNKLSFTGSQALRKFPQIYRYISNFLSRLQ